MVTVIIMYKLIYCHCKYTYNHGFIREEHKDEVMLHDAFIANHSFQSSNSLHSL